MPAPRRSTLSLQQLEARDVPAALEWALPPGDGAYSLIVSGPDLVLQRVGGAELARTTAAGAEVAVRGNTGDQDLRIDVAAGPAGLRVSADGGGGEDSVRFAIGTGDAVATMDGGQVTVRSSDAGWNIRLDGFTTVEANANTQGYNQIDLRDSRLSDQFVFSPAGGVLRRGDGITHTFTGFNRVKFAGDSGGKSDRDVVQLTGGPEGSSYRAIGRSGMFLDAENRFDVRLRRLDAVTLDGTAGGLHVLSRAAVGHAVHAAGFRPISILRFDYRLSRDAALHWIKRIAVKLDPGLADVANRTELVIRLRDFVHHRVRQGGNTPAWPRDDAYERFLQAVVSRQEAVSCQGAAWLYRDLLNAFGIVAREVSLFSPTPGVNHAVVDVWLGGRWVAMDPTFNVSFTDMRGRRLSYQEMRRLRQWSVRDDGTVARHGWVINQKVPYARYLFRTAYPPVWK
jgi:hypothetical protein